MRQGSHQNIVAFWHNESMPRTRDNILISCAGRRVALVRHFLQDVTTLGVKSRVLTSDVHPQLSAACNISDAAFRVPAVADEAFNEEFLTLLEAEGIGIVLPTIDPELSVYAAAAANPATIGTSFVISERPFIERAADKTRTPLLFDEVGVTSPHAIAPDNVVYPCFVKPRAGSSSIDVHVVCSPDDLREEYLTDPSYLIQEYIDPSDYDEFTIDLYYSRDSQLKCLVPRLRLETRAGEISKGLTVRDALYNQLRDQFAVWQGARGPLAVQVFANKDRSRILGIEVNARFGGGFPLSYQAGAHYPEWLIREYLLGEELSFFDGWREDLLMLRYDEAVYLNGTSTHP